MGLISKHLEYRRLKKYYKKLLSWERQLIEAGLSPLPPDFNTMSKGNKMSDTDKTRKLHGILDSLLDRNALDSSDIAQLRAALPELPKQKTLEELCHEVCDVWAGTNSNKWPDDVYGDLETWLDELLDQMKGLIDDNPAHPEFLETESDYVNTPVGTVAIHEDGYPWTRIFGSWVAYSCGQYTPHEMAALRGKARVLRWGNK